MKATVVMGVNSQYVHAAFISTCPAAHAWTECVWGRAAIQIQAEITTIYSVAIPIACEHSRKAPVQDSDCSK